MLSARLYPFRLLFPALLLAVLTGCASLPEYDPPRIGVAGIAPLDSQGADLILILGSDYNPAWSEAP